MQSKRNLTSLGLIALILGTVLFSGSSASAAITANGTVTSAQTANATSLTWSHTVAAGTNRVLFVQLAIDGLGASVTGVTYGGVALTQVGRGTGNHAVEIWRLINPTAGTANVVASFAGTTAAAGGATTFNGVNQSTPTGTFVSATGTGTTASVTAASAAGDLVIDAQYWKNTTANIIGAGQTSQWSASNASMLGGSTSEAGAASVTMTGMCGASSSWEIGAVSIHTDGVAGMNIGGTVYEDVNYGGGAGRNWATASGNGGSARPAARVELFDATGAFVTSTTTDASGNYSFASVTAGNYTVRVVSSSVTSGRTGYVAALRPVQTYRTNASTGTAVGVTDFVGGHDPATVDAGNAAAGWVLNSSTGVFSGGGSGKAHAFAPITVSAADVTGVNFGWNFDTIVNINNTGQGSLRQFITNANTLGGDASLAQSGLVAAKENAVFMISNGTAAAGLRSSNNYFSGGVATISPTSALPAISTVMVLDAQKQPGWGSVPIIELNGTGAGGAARGVSLSSGSAGSAIRGLVINRFGSYGVYVNSANNVVAGNYIGTNAGGTAAAGNGSHGVMIDGAAGNTIGGTTAASRNVISGNTGNYGVLIGNAGSTGNVVQGNYIGLNAAGTAAVANAGGVYVSTANNTIGGTAAGAGNVISGNTFDAVDLNTATATGNVVQGNFLGTDASGTLALGGGYGVNITGGASNNTVGGTVANAGNLISGSTAGGVMVQGASTGNAILGNSIYSNSNATGSGLGIDLGANGVTANNGTKTAGQPNLLMDFPAFTSALLYGTTLTVSGYVGSAPNQATFANARVELFKSDNDPSGYGEGQTYLGFLTADANGNFSGSLDVTGKGLNAGDKITGTATDASNNTSEFGANFTCTPLTLAIVKQIWNLNGSAPLGSPVTAPAGSTLVFLIYVKNTTAATATDIRINDLLDQTGFDYVSGSLVRTLAASPPADTATDKQLFDATDPGTGTALSDNLDGDVGSAQDTGAPVGVDRITVGAVSGQANGSLTITAHTAFALRFTVKIK